MIEEITLATTNQGKIKELQRALSSENIKLKGLPASFNCPETATSFEGNALLKAQMSSRLYHTYSLADDSGLCIEALSGEPGILSARYFREGQGIEKILQRLAGLTNRQAYFICALVLTDVQGKVVWQTSQKWHGRIAQKALGQKGFGYDPIFIPENSQITVSEMDTSLKEKQSHRGQALQEFKTFLQNYSNPQ